MSFLSELAFTSALVYSKRGSSAKAEKSRELRDRLKRGDPVLALAVEMPPVAGGMATAHG